MQKQDFVILGAGLSGLMTAVKMVEDPYFSDKSILILDKSEKQANDRTWCFWAENTVDWDGIISKKWESVIFKSEGFDARIPLKSYSYNKIESQDFYRLCFEKISEAPNVQFKTEAVRNIQETPEAVTVTTETSEYRAKVVLTSLLPPERLKNQSGFPVLQQHFIGWFIKTETPVFNPAAATFMDFTVPQRGNTRFMYVLPTSPTEALVEYTLFSEHLLPDTEYEAAIKTYLEEKDISNYQITATEKGCIPMTAYPFEKHNTARIIHIGTAGGWTRGSTGFTFRYTDKLSQQLIDHLKTGQPLKPFKIADRYRWFDKIFLDVLYRKNEMGAEIFTAMFQKNPVDRIFRFLDGESSLKEDLKIVWSVPKKEFIKSFFGLN